MPYTFNGVGTSYWGKANLETVQGECEHCQNAGELRSYDTSKYFVVLFIPVLPLGRLRILDECPHCRRHRAMKLKQWQRLRREAVPAAIREWTDHPSDAELAKAALQACAFYNDQQSLVSLTGKILTRFPNDTEMMAYVASLLEYFGHYQEAERLLRRALEIESTPEIREPLGVILLRQGRPDEVRPSPDEVRPSPDEVRPSPDEVRPSPDEARPLLEHLLEAESVGDAGVLFLLVEGYQARGQHLEALALLEEIGRAFPDVVEDAGFMEYQNASENNRSSGKPVPSAVLAAPPGPQLKAGPDPGRRIAALVSAAVLILIAGALAAFVFRGMVRHDVYLVNGLDRPYTVQLAGERHILPPSDALAVNVAQRVDLVVEVAEGGPPVEPVSFRIETPSGQLLGSGKTYVINPDRVAILFWHQIEYAEHPDPNREAPYELRTGEAFSVHDGIDFAFTTPPDEVTLPSGSSRTLKESLSVIGTGDHAPLDLFYWLMGELGQEVALSYLKRLVELVPGDEGILGVLAALMPREEFVALSAPHREARPIEVQWHRAYQHALGQAGENAALNAENAALNAENAALNAEYARYLEAEPDDSMLLYLAARIELDPDRAEARLRRAIEIDAENAYALNGLAYQKVAMGAFAEGLALVAEARRLMPDQLSFQTIERTALLGLGRYDALLEENLKQQIEQPLIAELVAQEILLRSARGELEEAAGRVEAYLERLAAAEDPSLGDPGQWRIYLEAMAAHGRGDLAAYGEKIGALEGAINAFQSALIRGAVAEAAAALEEVEGAGADLHLLLYLGAARGGSRTLAGHHLEAAIALLREGDPVQRLIAAGLAGEAPAGVDFLRLDYDPGSKAIALAALARRDRRHARAYRALAGKLNVQLGFPRLFLDQVLSS